MEKYSVKVSGVFVKTLEVESYSQEGADKQVELDDRLGKLDLGVEVKGGLFVGEFADGLPYISPSYIKNIANTLKDIPEDKQFSFRYQISDCVAVVTKNTLIDRARRGMPIWFLQSMCNVRVETDKYGCITVEPVFCRIQQAAWDAALSEFYKDKMEWCSKYGCE